MHALNAEIGRLVQLMNTRPFKRLPGCRQSRFDDVERQALRPLPVDRFEYVEWTGQQTVGPDYHLEVQHHWYSVPCSLVGQKVDARISAATIELFCKGKRIASHPRNRISGGHTTHPDHQPPQHRAYAERTPERFVAWAEKIGPNLFAVVRHQFDRPLPIQGLNACDVLKRLAQQYGAAPLEEAAKRALEIKSPTAKSIRSLLQTGRYTRAADELPPSPDLPQHGNVRGPGYYAHSLQKGMASC